MLKRITVRTYTNPDEIFTAFSVSKNDAVVDRIIRINNFLTKKIYNVGKTFFREFITANKLNIRNEIKLNGFKEYYQFKNVNF